MDEEDDKLHEEEDISPLPPIDQQVITQSVDIHLSLSSLQNIINFIIILVILFFLSSSSTYTPLIVLILFLLPHGLSHLGLCNGIVQYSELYCTGMIWKYEESVM